MNLDGILPSGGVEEGQKIKLPNFIPKEAVFEISSQDDVDELPRGAMARLMVWDEDLVLDLMVAGAALTLVSRDVHEEIASHDDFDPDGFGIIDGDGLWLPGLKFAYTPEDDGWRIPESTEEA